MALGDPSMWIRNPMSWKSETSAVYSDKHIAQALTDSGVYNLNPANNNRINGWRNMAQLMHFSEDTKPHLYIIDKTCPNLERTLPVLVRDEKHPEDIDTTQEDHAADAARYSLTSVYAPTVKEKEKPRLQQEYEKLIQMPDKDDWGWEF